MHEMAVVRSIADTILDHLPPDASLQEAVVEVGALEHLDPAVVESAWRALAADGAHPPLSRARLTLRSVPVRVRCEACGLEHAPEEAACLLCPDCGLARPRVLSGWGVVLARLVVDLPDERESTPGRASGPAAYGASPQPLEV